MNQNKNLPTLLEEDLFKYDTAHFIYTLSSLVIQ